ncbi:hypothetical protein [Oceanirhabdus sp. W0125-5]|uniref:hypothetical protein n=1 Tax=Oceanirhabdus sp. W0125-5 TaxID=2999116 RepID=UPI0022F34073|nr:hypothetical protein [Oceanirhabdus sp. W0125-5]WBW99124.1 hypothetical protein OW730_10365 [Oceanirhabdus sp. W0125-5]
MSELRDKTLIDLFRDNRVTSETSKSIIRLDENLQRLKSADVENMTVREIREKLQAINWDLKKIMYGK